MNMPEPIEQPAFFVLGYWCNAYRISDREYFWMGIFEERVHAKAALSRKMKNGQPKTFIDWCGGSGKVYNGKESFIAACQKVGINPNLENAYYV